MQNSVISTWITCLYVSQPSSVVFAFKTAHFVPELQVSMGPRPHLSFWAFKTGSFAPEWLGYMNSSPHLSFCACKTASLGPDLQVCMGPRPHLRFGALITACLAQEQEDSIAFSPHLWFCACKTASLGLELQFLGVQDSTCGFCMQNSDFWIRITSLNVSQIWPDILCMYKSVISTRNTSLYEFQPSSVVFACKTASFWSEKRISMGPRPNLSFRACKTAWFAPEWQAYMGSSPHLCFYFHAKQWL